MSLRSGFPPIAALLLLLVAGDVARAQAVRLRPSAEPIYAGGEGAALSRPEAVACGKSTLVVADSGNARLIRFNSVGGVVTPAEVIPVPRLPNPVGVQIDGDGNLWVLDGRTHRIGRLTPAGQFAEFFDLGGESDRDVMPRAFRIGADGNLYVLDVRGERVRVYSRDGTPRRSVAFPDEIGFLSDLAVDSTGTIFAVDSVAHRVLRAGKDDDVLKRLSNDLAEDLNFATGITDDGRGHLLLADQNGGGIVVLGRDGAFRGRQLTWGWKVGMLRYPTDLCVQGRTLFVADRGNNRVQIFEILE